MNKSKMYVASWVLTWLMLQATKIITIIGAGLLVVGEMDAERFNFGQIALIKFGAIIIGFIVVMVLNRVIEAVEHYCHEKDI